MSRADTPRVASFGMEKLDEYLLGPFAEDS